ncbi:hypothetical protein D3C79_745260 [compost metagenome]
MLAGFDAGDRHFCPDASRIGGLDHQEPTFALVADFAAVTACCIVATLDTGLDPTAVYDLKGQRYGGKVE